MSAPPPVSTDERELLVDLTDPSDVTVEDLPAPPADPPAAAVGLAATAPDLAPATEHVPVGAPLQDLLAADGPRSTRRRRQFGADRRTEPNPTVARPGSGRALALGRLALVVTMAAWCAVMITVVGPELVSNGWSARSIAETAVYAVIVTFLMMSALAYLVTRQGYLRRTRSHVRTPRAELEAFFDHSSPSVTVLIPSYREQPAVILQTVLSAALQECTDMRVVLLIDDPPTPDRPEQQQLLEQARAVPDRVTELLAAPRARFTRSLALAQARRTAEPSVDDLSALATDYDHAASWLEDLGSGWPRTDHTDDFFVDRLLLVLARDLRMAAAAVQGAILNRSRIDADRVAQMHRRLASIFTAELHSFERKSFLNLSDEPNKAMNLNGYIGLMGGSYCEQATSAGALLLQCDAADPEASVHIPMTDYIVTLDADSVLLPEYCLRLVHEAERPGNERIGVIQTPYSSFNGAHTRVERLAGATTDLQYMVHQGMAEHGAGFWVGANAVLRTEAVMALRDDDDTDGHTVSRFISDRTVIEDTESTLDLTTMGWTVENYPERMAYSASPPDFGTLCIQRQRWANGGLIILGKLRGHWRAKKERGEARRPIELLLRLNYLASISWSTVGLVLLLVYPFGSGLMSGLVVVMSAPYFIVMATDLKRCGYKHSDIFRVYGFNLIMLPVNASGVLRSVVQVVTGQKSSFARTPKVRKRSAAPASFVLFAYAIVILSAVTLYADVNAERWAHAVFAGANFLIAVPAIVAIIGVRNSVLDIWVGFANQLYRRERRVAAPATLDPVVDWAAVLYHGSVDKPRAPHRTSVGTAPVIATAGLDAEVLA